MSTLITKSEQDTIDFAEKFAKDLKVRRYCCFNWRTWFW